MATRINNTADNMTIQGGSRCVVRNAADTLYAVLIDNTNNTIEVYKSADGSSWAIQDVGNSPTNADTEMVAAAIDSGDILHITWWDTGVGLRYVTFDADGTTDTFGTPETAQTEAGPATTNYLAISIDANDKPHIAFVDRAAPSTVDYYFNSASTTNWTDVANMVDGSLSTFAYTSSDGTTETLDANNYAGGGSGSISAVNMRVYADGDGGDQVTLTPSFNGSVGDAHLTTPGTSPDWTVYVDITTDTNAPTPWTWGDITTLDTDVQFDKDGKANQMDVYKVEIQVTYGGDVDTVFYTNKTGAGWSTRVEVEGETNSKTCRFPDITINDETYPEIAYLNETDSDVGTALGNANDATSFSLYDIEASGTTGYTAAPTIAVDTGGNTYVAYLNSTNQLKSRKHNDGDGWTTWQTATTIESTHSFEMPNIVINGTDIYVFAIDKGTANDVIAGNSFYQYGLEGGKMRIGGFGDTYKSWIEFDISGLPSSADTETAELMMYCDEQSGDTETDLYYNTASWDELTLTYATSPAATTWGQFLTPTADSWDTLDITQLYKDWKDATKTNYGVQLQPTATSNDFNGWMSSNTATSPSLRPKLVITKTVGAGGETVTEQPYPRGIVYYVDTGSGYSSQQEVSMLSQQYFKTKWSYLNDNDGSTQIDFVYQEKDDNTDEEIDVWWDKYILAVGATLSQSLADSISFTLDKEFAPTHVKIDTVNIAELFSSQSDYNISDLYNLTGAVDLETFMGYALLSSADLTITSEKFKGKEQNQTDSFNIIENILKEVDLGLVDTYSLTEQIIKIISSSRLDNLILLESFKKDQRYSLSNLIFFVDSLTKTSNKYIDSTFNFTDSLASASIYQKALVDTFVFVDVIQKITGLSVTDSFNLAEQIALITGTEKTLLDTFQIVENLIKSSGVNLNIQDSFIFLESLFRAFNLVKTDQISVTKALIKTFGLSLTTDFILSESLQNGLKAKLSDIFDFAEILTKTTSKNITETLSIVESEVLTSQFVKTLTENISLIEAIINSIDLTKEETISLIEVSSTIFSKERRFTELLSTTESIVLTVAFISALTDTFTISEIISKKTGLSRLDSFNFIEELITSGLGEQSLSDSLALTEDVSKKTGKTIDDSFTIIETLVKILTVFRQDTLSLAEAFQKELDVSKQDTLAFLETFAIERDKIFADLFNVSETVVKSPKKVFAENIPVVETLTPIAILARSFSDSLILSDQIYKDTSLSKTESVSIAELFNSSFASKIALTDNLTIQEAMLILTEHQKTLDDSIVFIEILKKRYSINITDVLPIFELISTVSPGQLSLTETLLIIESLIKDTGLKVIDALSIIESLISTRDLDRIDNVSISEQLSKTFELSNEDSLDIVENFIKAFGTRKQVTIQISDTISHIYGLQNTDSVIFSDVFKKETSKQNIENILFSDTLTTSSTFQRSLIDLMSIIDSISTPAQILTQTVSDLFSIAETIKKNITIPKDEVLIISEDKIKELDKNIIDSLTIEELLSKDSVYYVDLIDSSTLVDSFSPERSISFTDSFTIADLISMSETETLGGFAHLLSDKNKATLKTKQGQTILLSNKNAAIIRTKDGKTILLTK